MKKITKVVSLLLVTMLMVTACGSKETSKNEDNNVDNNEDNNKTKVQQEESNSGLEGELVYWSTWNKTEPQGMVINEAINSFMKKHPAVKVKVQWNGRENTNLVQPAIDNGETIDIFDRDLEGLVKNWKDYTLNLDTYISKSYDSTNGNTYEEEIMDSVMSLSKSYSEDGSVYGVPYQPYIFAFMYNKAHFEDAGIEKAPTTWKEFLDVCEKLKNKGYEPITTDDAYMETLAGTHLARLKGAKWVEQLVQDKTNAMWDDEAVLKMAEQFEELATKGYFSKSVAANKFPAGQQDVASGNVTMYLNGSWLINEVKASTGPDFKWGTFVYPAIEGGNSGTNVSTYGAQSFGINKECKYPDVAFELIAHITTGEWDSKLAKETIGVPVSKGAEWPAQLQEAKIAFENLDSRYPYGCGIYGNADKTPFIKEGFTRLVSGEITAKEFIDQMKK